MAGRHRADPGSIQIIHAGISGSQVMKQDVKAKFPKKTKKHRCFEIIDFLNLPLNFFLLLNQLISKEGFGIH